MTTLTKQEFWNPLEEKYPKAMKDFRKWVDHYKDLNDWNELFNEHDDGVLAMGIAPKYHELPDYMQFGIFCQYLVEHENYYVGVLDITNPKQIITQYIEKLEDWC